MNYIIRNAVKTDISTILSLCSEHAVYERIPFSPENKADKLSKLLFNDKPYGFCLIAECEGKAVGYATYSFEFSTWDSEMYVHMDCLYLQENFRGYGIGEALVKRIAQNASKNNIRLLQWHTPPFNERAIKFYKRIGATSREKVRFYLNEGAIKQLIQN